MGRDQQSWSKCHCWTWCCVRSGQCSRIEMGKQWLGASCWEGNIQNWLLLAHRSDKTCILRFGNTGRPRKVVLLLLSLLFFFEFFLEENPSFWIEFFCWIAMAFFKVSVRGLHRAKTSIHSYQAHFNSPILTTSLCRLLEKACGISLLFPLRLTCELNSLLFLYIRIFWENFKPCAVLEKNRKCLCGHKAKAYTFFPCTIWRIRPQKKKKKKKIQIVLVGLCHLQHYFFKAFQMDCRSEEEILWTGVHGIHRSWRSGGTGLAVRPVREDHVWFCLAPR